MLAPRERQRQSHCVGCASLLCTGSLTLLVRQTHLAESLGHILALSTNLSHLAPGRHELQTLNAPV
jgi:hypothetical protein